MSDYEDRFGDVDPTGPHSKERGSDRMMRVSDAELHYLERLTVALEQTVVALEAIARRIDTTRNYSELD